MSATTPSIAEQVTELQAGIADRLPAEAAAVFAAEQASLKSVAAPEPGISIGEPLPDAELLDAHGRPTTLADAVGERPAVVVFYRGAWCPYCNLALRAYQHQLLGDLTSDGIALLAVSPQKPDGSLTMQEKNELTFPVVSDPGNQLARALGILTAPTPEAQAAQAELGLDLEVVNADGSRTIPMPTVALLDAERRLRWLDVHVDYTARTEPTEILAAVGRHLDR